MHHEGAITNIDVDVSSRDDVDKLRGSAVGLLSVLFLCVTGSAPLAVTLFNTPYVGPLGSGWGGPGAFLFATIVLQVSFQALPAFVRLTSGDLVTLQAFGGLVLLLFWLYLMANVLVLGAEVNWWFRYGRVEIQHDEPGTLTSGPRQP